MEGRSLGPDHQLSDGVETMSEVAQEGYREKQKKGKMEACGRPGSEGRP